MLYVIQKCISYRLITNTLYTIYFYRLKIQDRSCIVNMWLITLMKKCSDCDIVVMYCFVAYVHSLFCMYLMLRMNNGTKVDKQKTYLQNEDKNLKCLLEVEIK